MDQGQPPQGSNDIVISAGIVLATTPPREPQRLLDRPQLGLAEGRLRNASVLLLHAPPGYAKTAILCQWRREALRHGRVVLWLSARADDTPARLILALTHAFRTAACRPNFGHTILEALDSAPEDSLGALTCWLAAVAEAAVETVVIIDEAEKLPGPSRGAVEYLLRNLPVNLRAFVALRSDQPGSATDLAPFGQCEMLTAADTGFTLDETVAILRDRTSPALDHETAARLHDLTEGWPLGIQLVLSLLQRGPDAALAAKSLLDRGGVERSQLLSRLLGDLDPADDCLLSQLSMLEVMTPELAAAMTGDGGAADRLRRLAAQTSLVIALEGGDWLRLHALVRGELRKRFDDLPETERRQLHRNAARWLAEHDLSAQAAHHALAAGDIDWACDLAERKLYDTVMRKGRLTEAMPWLDMMPREQLDARPQLLVAGAWCLALGEHHQEAGRLIDRIRAQGAIDPELDCECDLILGAAAIFADLPDQLAALYDRWGADPPLRDPMLLQVHANRSAYRDFIAGRPAHARLHQHGAMPPGFRPPAFLQRLNDGIVGLSYLWEGQVGLAEVILRPASVQSDVELGRRHPFSTILAALLATTQWEQDQPDQAVITLANRLDVLEQSGMPEALQLGYRTLARAALAEGDEHRALQLLEALHAIAQRRNLPRLRVVALTEQIHLHARSFRAVTCADLLDRIETLLEGDVPDGPLWQAAVRQQHQIARGHVAVAAREWRDAIAPLQAALDLARDTRKDRLRIELMGMLALVRERLGDPGASAMLEEARGLAQAYRLHRVLTDAHPLLGDWVRRLDQRDQKVAEPVPATPAPKPTALPDASPADAVRSGVLTPKEAEIIELLARSLSNKEIGRALNIHEDTVKWHMKNLFSKLNAGSRKHVVGRARLMGFLPPEG
ncbi:LuxR C-terminal-related transcriptional regulator [Paracoccus sp. S1E-3]|uniref:LuxR C-terminal-related transcriptional regulator n=1 Tax=Paracoccus sp. S1E-3 TaxID=2756130 RepID=UPI0015EFB06B|nr:LuxR C-terminal-related transcriptional regulator [Paracoccus sp. S1E-3]MBA4491732.1 LuxR family transcriptional regulator [Paracoccus sp. S1E-3]